MATADAKACENRPCRALVGVQIDKLHKVDRDSGDFDVDLVTGGGAVNGAGGPFTLYNSFIRSKTGCGSIPQNSSHLFFFAPFRMSQKFTVSPLFDDLSTTLVILKVYMTAVFFKRNTLQGDRGGIYGDTK